MGDLILDWPLYTLAGAAILLAAVTVRAFRKDVVNRRDRKPPTF